MTSTPQTYQEMANYLRGLANDIFQDGVAEHRIIMLAANMLDCAIQPVDTPHDSNAPTRDAVEVAARAIYECLDHPPSDEGMDFTYGEAAKAALSAAYPALVNERDALKGILDNMKKEAHLDEYNSVEALCHVLEAYEKLKTTKEGK